MAGGQLEAGQRAGPEQRRVVGGAGPQPGAGLGQRQFGDAGQQFVGVAQQFVDAAGGDGGVPAEFLAGGADDQLPVLAGHEVEGAAADDGADGAGEEGPDRRGGRHPQPQHLSFDGAYRGDGLVGEAGEGAAAGAEGEHRLPGPHLVTVVERGPDGTVPGDQEAGGKGAVEGDAFAFAGPQQCGGQSARVDLVVAVHAGAAAYGGGEHGFEAAAFASGQPAALQSAPLLEGVEFPQVGAVVGVEGDGEGAAGAVADAGAGGVFEFGDEVRVPGGGGEVEVEQRFLAVVEFGDGGEHARRDLGGAAAGFGVGDGDGQAALGGPPGGDEADDAAAEDEDVGAAGAARGGRRAAHGFAAAPFAGMTRIRFGRSEAVSASLSARCARAPACAVSTGTSLLRCSRRG
ncbi:hypothetical protein STAL104432_21250 [Streptomyces albus]